MSTLPKGPRSAMVATIGYLRHPFRGIARCQQRYGDTFTVPSLRGPIVVTADPAGARALFGADPEIFASTMSGELEPIIGPGSVMTMAGGEHRKARKLLAPPFHGDRMRVYGRLMADIAARRARSWKPGQPFAMEAEARAISLDVIIEAVLGIEGEERVATIHQQILALVASVKPWVLALKPLWRVFPGGGPLKVMHTRKAAFDAIIADEIAKRRRPADSGPKRADILSLLLEVRYDDGRGLSDAEIIDELMTLLVAGHETTATAIAWIMYELHRAPEALDQLRQELAAAPRGPHAEGSGPDPDALARLPWLDAVCQETLRLRPGIPLISRRLVKPFEWMGYQLPAGVTVAAAMCLIHMRPDIYPEPERFRPARFRERTYTLAEYFPWGGGARRCLGAAFAAYEVKVVLGTLLDAHRYRLIDTDVQPETRLATVGPKGGVRMAVEAEAGAEAGARA